MALGAEGEPNYVVVVNGEDQYSVWLAGRDIPAGWRSEGMAGTTQACLEHIDRVWTDLRPLSLRANSTP